MKQDIEILKAGNTGDIFKDVQNIIEQTRNYAYQAVNVAMVQRNWLLGKRIADEELQGENWNLCHADNRGWLVAKRLSNGLLTTLQICMVRASQRAISIGLFSL